MTARTQNLVDRCLRKEPNRHYPDAAALLEDLSECRKASASVRE